ncbi:MAG: response regulator [Bdellovibrionales bacterium]
MKIVTKMDTLAATPRAHTRTPLTLAPERRQQRPLNILIVDDDIDSALQVRSIFSRLGCEVTCSLSWIEAKKKMCASKIDLIILDWILDRHIDAGEVVNQCARTFSKRGRVGSRRKGLRPKVITYSSLEQSEIKWLENAHFEHLAHWHKPITQRELLVRVLEALGALGR